MKICMVADGQSPHSRSWIRRLTETDEIELHLVSTFPFEKDDLKIHSSLIVPTDLTAHARAKEKLAAEGGLKTEEGRQSASKLRGTKLWKTFARLKDELSPFVAQHRSRYVREFVRKLKPDLVHAMRIPFEGILASQAVMRVDVPLLISTWGNDFTLYASRSQLVHRFTVEAMRRADGIHSDCFRDIRLAWEHRYPKTKPTVVLPGNGGVDVTKFCPGPKSAEMAERLGIPPDAFVVLNPRGVKPYIRTREFLASIPTMLAKAPNLHVVALGFSGKSIADNIPSGTEASRIHFLTNVPHAEMPDLFRLSDVVLSPSDHDGTPNSLLEAMACGCFPVAGNIESVREWISTGQNGLLIDQTQPQAIAEGVLQAMEDHELRTAAVPKNLSIIDERAALETVFRRAIEFYSEVRDFRAGEGTRVRA